MDRSPGNQGARCRSGRCVSTLDRAPGRGVHPAGGAPGPESLVCPILRCDELCVTVGVGGGSVGEQHGLWTLAVCNAGGGRLEWTIAKLHSCLKWYAPLT